VGTDEKPWYKSGGVWLIVASVALAALTVKVGTQMPPKGEEPNRLATSLLQGITLVFGTFGSWLLGRDTSREAAREAVRPHARSSFRRVLTLYRALGRLRDTSVLEADYLAEQQDEEGRVDLGLALASLDKIRLMSIEQTDTADNALDDWRDLAPEEVAKIEQVAGATDPAGQSENVDG
jgi:hypothetical protein